jgi:hypothetical protein
MSEIDIIKNKFNAKNQWALVVGDLMLDRYLIGSVSRISPEAPVPVVRLKESFDRIGGSGNVAANLAQLGIKTILAGQIGDDGDGKKLLDILKKNHIGVDGIVKDKNPTTTKTRIIGEHQQMMRIDQEATADLIDSKPLIKRISTLLNKKPSIVILSDYAKGVLSEALCQHVIKLAKSKKIPVLVDPKGIGPADAAKGKAHREGCYNLGAMDPERDVFSLPENRIQRSAKNRPHRGAQVLGIPTPSQEQSAGARAAKKASRTHRRVRPWQTRRTRDHAGTRGAESHAAASG